MLKNVRRVRKKDNRKYESTAQKILPTPRPLLLNFVQIRIAILNPLS